MKTPFEQFLEDRLKIYHETLLQSPKNVDKTNEIIISQILNFLNPKKRKEIERQINAEKMLELEKEGKSLYEIAILFGTSKENVHKYISKLKQK